MADIKKISELSQIQSLSNDDEFVVVDKSTTNGENASSSGKTSRVTLSQLKQAVGASGPKGDKGDKGDTGDEGPQGSPGLKGDKGDQGIQGTKGDKGDQGIQGPIGPSGSPGQLGPVGQRGQPGPAGDKGATGEKGSRGDQGAEGKPGTNGQTGQTGPVGPQGIKGALGPIGKTGPAGAKGAPGTQGVPGNSNAHLMWKGVGVATDPTGQKMLKTDALSSWTNGYAYTKLSYAGGCSLSFVPGPVKRNFMMGLASLPGKMGTSYNQIEFGFNLVSDGRLQVYENGSFRGDYGTYTESSILTITYDGSFVKYYCDGKFLRGLGKYSSKVFSAQIAVHTGNAVVTSAISFNASGQTGPVGAKGASGTKGDTGLKGDRGLKGDTGLKGDRGLKGDTGQKGATGASGVFNGGTISNSTTINSSSDQKLILQGTSSPYIRFREGTTDKAYIQWNANGNFYFVNQESGEHLRIGSSTDGLIFHSDGTDRTVYHSGNLSPLRTNADQNISNYQHQTRFYSNTAINTTSGDQASLEVFQPTKEKDAFMTFHVAGDYAAYFGLDGTTNDLSFGGWSRGANKYRVWHAGNLSAVTTANNTGLNSDSRNSRGVTRLYRRDSDSDYSVQTYWTSSGLNKHLWRLHGYSGDSSHAGCQVEYADHAGTAKKTTGMPSVTNPVNNNLIANGNSSKKSTVDITKYGIPENSGARWGIFTTNMAGGSWPNHQVWVYSTTNWTNGNLVAANHSDKSQHNTFQYMAPIVNNRYCYIYNIENSSDGWGTYFMGVV